MATCAVSKSALQGLARGLARNVGLPGITVNVVQPGPVDTDASPGNGPMKELMRSFMTIKRHGRPEEVAGMVAWLAGPKAAFVTGAMHTIDGALAPDGVTEFHIHDGVAGGLMLVVLRTPTCYTPPERLAAHAQGIFYSA